MVKLIVALGRLFRQAQCWACVRSRRVLKLRGRRHCCWKRLEHIGPEPVVASAIERLRKDPDGAFRQAAQRR